MKETVLFSCFMLDSSISTLLQSYNILLAKTRKHFDMFLEKSIVEFLIYLT